MGTQLGTSKSKGDNHSPFLINKLVGIVNSSLDIEEIWNTFTNELRSYVDVDWASLICIEGNSLRIYALSSTVDSVWHTGDTFPKEEIVADWAWKGQTLLVEEDLAKNRRFWIGRHGFAHGIS